MLRAWRRILWSASRTCLARLSICDGTSFNSLNSRASLTCCFIALERAGDDAVFPVFVLLVLGNLFRRRPGGGGTELVPRVGVHDGDTVGFEERENLFDFVRRRRDLVGKRFVDLVVGEEPSLFAHGD